MDACGAGLRRGLGPTMLRCRLLDPGARLGAGGFSAAMWGGDVQAAGGTKIPWSLKGGVPLAGIILFKSSATGLPICPRIGK